MSSSQHQKKPWVRTLESVFHSCQQLPPVRNLRLDLLTASAVLLFVVTGLGLLGAYEDAYQPPAQSALPQGSWRPDAPGWEVERGSVRLEEPGQGSPFYFLHLEGGTARSELAMGPAWRKLHLGLWARLRGQPAVLRGVFWSGQRRLGEDELICRPGSGWHRTEAIWSRPLGADRLELALSCAGEADLAELSVVPSYLDSKEREVPTY